MNARNFPETFMDAQLIIELPVVLEPERLLSCSRKSATASYPEPLNKALIHGSLYWLVSSDWSVS
jgi:hypothetical protein